MRSFLISTAALLLSAGTLSAQAPQAEAQPNASAPAAECYPTCRAGYVCNAASQCVSICNPVCKDDEICTAEATCISSPNAQSYPQPGSGQPPQGYGQEPQQNGWNQQQQQQQPGAQSGWEGPRATGPGPIARPGAFRLQLTFDPGFGGTISYTVDGDDAGEGDLATTLGARIQAQFSIGRFLYVGAEVGVDGYIGDEAPDDADRLVVIGLGPVFGFRYGLDLGAVAIEPTAGLGLGLAIATANDVDVEDTEFGLGVSFRAGVNLWFSETVGAHLDVGYQFHGFYGLGDDRTDVAAKLGQFRLGVGMAFRFGS